MANEVTSVLSQIQYTGKGPLDARSMPVVSVSELPKRLASYPGQTIVVLSGGTDGNARDYWYVGSKWQPKPLACDGLSLSADTEGNISLTYSGTSLGTVSISGFIQSLKNDKYISGASIVNSGKTQYLKLTYADNSTPIMVDLSPIVGTKYTQGSGITISSSNVISVDFTKVAKVDDVNAVSGAVASAIELAENAIGTIADVSAATNTLINAVDEINSSTIPGIVSEIDTIREDISGLTSAVAENTEDIVTLDSRTDELENAFSGLTDELSGLNGNIQAVSGAVGSVANAVDGAITAAEEAAGVAEEAQNAVAGLSGEVSTLKETIKNIKAASGASVNVDGVTIVDTNNELSVKIANGTEEKPNALESTDEGLFVSYLYVERNDDKLNNK